MPLPLLALGFAAVGAVGAFSGASQANKAAKKTAKNAAATFEANKAIIGMETDDEIARLAKAFGKFSGTAQVSASERGAQGRTADLIQQSGKSAAFQDQMNLIFSEYTSILSAAADTTGTIQRAKSSTVNPFSAGLSGGMSGLLGGAQLDSILNKKG
jgi:hypothetical protein